MRPGRSAGAVALLLVLAGAPPGRAAVLDYLYLEPDVGGSAGGHVALRFGDTVFHFQNAEHGMLRLVREDWTYFRWAYSVRENRTIAAARIRVSADTRARLRAAFNRRYLVERRHFVVLGSLGDDARLLRLLGRCEGDGRACAAGERDGVLRLRGTGYFFGDGAGSDDPVSGDLRARVLARHGPAFLRERIAALERALGRLEPSSPPAPPAEVRPDAYPLTAEGVSERRAALAQELLALRVLEERRRVRPVVLRAPAEAEFVLSVAERRSLTTYAGALADDLLRLLTSSRPDRGYPLLVGMARLQALAATLARGRLVVLDTFPDDAPTLDGRVFRRRAALAAELLARGRRRLLAARARLALGGLGEGELQELEEAANRYDELARGLAEGRDVRLSGETLVPARAAGGIELPRPVVDRRALARAAEDAEAALRTHEARLHEVFGYHLTRRNCVSEIFATIDAALGPEGSAAHLGGRVDPDAPLGYVPAVSYRRVLGTYDVVAEGTVPSYRSTRLEELRRREHPLTVSLREASTLTSTIYRENDRDSFFLFFTDGARLPRPLLGVANVAAGTGEAALGVVRAPLDRGRALWAGMKGIAFSLPELVFVNLRKGTLEYAADEPPRTRLRWRPRAPAGAGWTRVEHPCEVEERPCVPDGPR